MKKLIKKLFGIDKLETEKTEAQAALTIAQEETKKSQDESYVAVLNTHVNKENIRNGFFELDWNDEFVVQLKQAGYGFDGDPEEEIVDRWFRDLAGNMLAEAGQDPSRATAGYINVSKLPNGRAQVE